MFKLTVPIVFVFLCPVLVPPAFSLLLSHFLTVFVSIDFAPFSMHLFFLFQVDFSGMKSFSKEGKL